MDKTKKNVSISELIENGDAVEMSHDEVRNLFPAEEEPEQLLQPTDDMYDRLIKRIDAENAAVHEEYLESALEEELMNNEGSDDSETERRIHDSVEIEDDIDIKPISYNSIDMGLDILMDKTDDENSMTDVGPDMEPEVKRVVKVEEEPIPESKPELVLETETKLESKPEPIPEIEFIPVPVPVEEETSPTPAVPSASEEDDIDLDLEDETKDGISDDERKEAEERLKRLQEEVSKKIKPVKNPIPLNTFKINHKVKRTPSSIFKKALIKNHATWITSGSKKSITITEFTGPEILKINRSLVPEVGRLTWYGNMLNTIYSHIQSSKPKSVNEWAKTTLVSDLDDIYFAIYAATYGTSNINYYDCDKCKHAWMSDSMPLNKFYKVKDEAKFKNALANNVSSSTANEIEVTLVQVTDDLVFAIRPMTLWNVFHELPIIGDTSYENIDILIQIETIYAINMQDSSLEEIDFKSYPDPDKTIKARYKYVDKFVNSLKPDQVALLVAAITEMNAKYETLVDYIIPETICPECGSHIDAQETAADNSPISGELLLFMRHQLGAMRS